MESQYIYLLQEREFIKTKENIYKIGKTKQVNNNRIIQQRDDYKTEIINLQRQILKNNNLL